MKILIHSQHADSMGIGLHMKEEGHDVRYFIEDKSFKKCGDGMIEKFDSMMDGIKWKPDYIIFDYTKKGKLADELRASGIPVFGGSDFADKLERDRKFGADFMEKCGIEIPETFEFSSLDKARSHVEKNPETYVIKMDGEAGLVSASSYVSKSPEDMIEYLNYLEEMKLVKAGTTFILQRKIEGVEVAIEAWFSHGKPIPPFNNTFETKKFMPGDLGPNTGCETSVIIPVKEGSKLFSMTLEKCFKEISKTDFTGMLDLNCMVSEKDHKPYAIEWTPRFGYSCTFADLSMMKTNIGELFFKLASGKIDRLPIVHNWGTSIRMSIPPYPNEKPEEIFKGIENQWVKLPKDLKNVWLLDVMKDDKDRILTCGGSGVIAECTGEGSTLNEAWKISQKNFDDVHVANKMGRYIDGIESAKKRINTLRSFGYNEMPSLDSRPSPFFKNFNLRSTVAKAA